MCISETFIFLSLHDHLSLLFWSAGSRDLEFVWQHFLFLLSHKVSLREENNRPWLLLTGNAMSGVHDATRSCDTQSLINKWETKILGLRGPWWDVVMCNARRFTSVHLNLSEPQRSVRNIDGAQKCLRTTDKHTNKTIGSPGLKTTSCPVSFSSVEVQIGN